MTDVWSVALRNINGSEIISNVPVKRWYFTRVLNAPGAFEATLNIADSGVTEANYKPAAREVVVYCNAQREWAGYLWHAAVGSPKTGAEVTLRGEGYYSRLRRRIVVSDLIYASAEQSQIAWNLIDHTQDQPSGDLGFTQGTTAGANVMRDERSYCATDRPAIASGIDELSSLIDGFDHEIDPWGVFRTWSPRRQNPSTVVFDGTFVVGGDYEIDGAEVATDIIFKGDDDCNPPFGTVTDAAAKSTYGLLQDTLDTETESWAESRSRANEELRQDRSSRWQTNVSWDEGGLGPAWADIELGDIVTYAAANGFATFSKAMRVTALGAAFEPGFRPRYTAQLDDAVDDL